MTLPSKLLYQKTSVYFNPQTGSDIFQCRLGKLLGGLFATKMLW